MICHLLQFIFKEMPSGRWNHFLLELKYGQRERSLNISDGNIIEIGLMEESWKAKSITFEPDVKNPSFLKLHICNLYKCKIAVLNSKMQHFQMI